MNTARDIAKKIDRDLEWVKYKRYRGALSALKVAVLELDRVKEHCVPDVEKPEIEARIDAIGKAVL